MRTRIALLALALLGATITSLVGASPAQSIAWAPAASASIHPGVQMVTGGGQCTANFVFTDPFGGTYLGYAAHCAGLGSPIETNGCTAPSLPLGTPVTIEGASRQGYLAYSSWVTMQQVHETDALACAYNDLALVKLHPDDRARVNPSIPHWGGPRGLNDAGAPSLSSVYSVGNSSLRQGLALLSPKMGVSLGTAGGGWTHPVYTLTPGIPGDSGSAFLDANGNALGVLSTLTLAPLAASNNVGDLAHELAYFRQRVGFPIDLALGTEPFVPGQLPVALG